MTLALGLWLALLVQAMLPWQETAQLAQRVLPQAPSAPWEPGRSCLRTRLVSLALAQLALEGPVPVEVARRAWLAATALVPWASLLAAHLPACRLHPGWASRATEAQAPVARTLPGLEPAALAQALAMGLAGAARGVAAVGKCPQASAGLGWAQAVVRTAVSGARHASLAEQAHSLGRCRHHRHFRRQCRRCRYRCWVDC